jgi:hypothetical protein
MNTYSKYDANVFLAKCPEPHEKGEEIPVTTKYGKENASIVHNLIYEKEGFFFYSITRADGFNTQERAKNKAERYSVYAASAEAKSNEYYDRSNKDKDFLSLGEPIKVGHHSEPVKLNAITNSLSPTPKRTLTRWQINWNWQNAFGHNSFKRSPKPSGSRAIINQ